MKPTNVHSRIIVLTNSTCYFSVKENYFEQVKHVCALHKDLQRAQIPSIIDNLLRTLIEDIRKFMREDFEDFETNQQVIGMKYLFRGFSIKVWRGTEFGCNKHKAYDVIVNQHCMNYH